jgi:hypothetical protein
VTWKRVWLLHAQSQQELNKWVKALDPTINKKEGVELKLKLELMQREVENKAMQLERLSGQLNKSDEQQQLRSKQFQSFCGSLVQSLDSLKEQLFFEKVQSSKKDELISQLQGELRALQQKREEAVSVEIQTDITLDSNPANNKELEDKIKEIESLKLEVGAPVCLFVCFRLIPCSVRFAPLFLPFPFFFHSVRLRW